MPSPTDRLIIGTAGHIDHGKSTLVEAMTGVDPDRLKEEKDRGITIVLGFAPLDLPTGRRCGVVDVPGHERLVRTMIAGASGIDLVLLVVAADEGTMPQTREHLAICELLGIEHGVVALTKTDLVDEEWLELVKDDLSEELSGTFLSEAPVVPCSSHTKDGFDELYAALDTVAERAGRRDPDGLLRMPVDRVFTMKGFGTVATGTLIGGRIRAGDPIELLPSNVQGRVRGLQVHGESVEDSLAGVRTAVNIQGPEAAEVRRGEWVVKPGSLTPTWRVEGRLTLLDAYPRPLKKRAPVLINAGTTQAAGTIRLLEGDKLSPGGSALVHLELEAPIVALPGDKLIVRGTERLEGHGHTIGGIEVARPHARRPRKPMVTVEELEALEVAETDEERISLVILQRGHTGMTQKELLPLLGIGPQAASRALKTLTRKGDLKPYGQQGYIHRDQLERLEERASKQLDGFHRDSPMEPGMPREELRSKLPGVSPALFSLLLDRLSRKSKIVVEQELLRRPKFRPRVDTSSAAMEKLKSDIAGRLERSGLTPPTDKVLAEDLALDKRQVLATLKLLVSDGKVVKVTEGLHFAQSRIDDLENRIIEHFENDENLDAQKFKAMTGASRKFTIPLAEYFDRNKLTLRIGDVRVLRRKPAG